MSDENVTTTEPREIYVKNVGQYTLLGAMGANFDKVKPEDLEAEVHIIIYQLEEDLDVFEEVNTLAVKYPKARISIKRSGNRDLWGMKKSPGRGKKTEDA